MSRTPILKRCVTIGETARIDPPTDLFASFLDPINRKPHVRTGANQSTAAFLGNRLRTKRNGACYPEVLADVRGVFRFVLNKQIDIAVFWACDEPFQQTSNRLPKTAAYTARPLRTSMARIGSIPDPCEELHHSLKV